MKRAALDVEQREGQLAADQVAAGGDGEVAGVGAAAVARVDRNRPGPVTVGHHDLDPGVGPALSEQVAGDVAGRDAEPPAGGERDVGVVLADAAPER